MTIEDNKAISRRVIAALNARDWDALRVVMAPDLADRFAGSPLLLAFPDMHIVIEEQLAEGDRVLTRWTNRGTHQGVYCGVSATGRRVEYGGMSIDRIDGGRVVANLGQADLLGLVRERVSAFASYENFSPANSRRRRSASCCWVASPRSRVRPIASGGA